MQPHEVPEEMHHILKKWYSNIALHELGRRIVIDAIAHTGPFADA